MTEQQDITPADRVTIAEHALNLAQQRVDDARRSHQEASSEYVNALRAFHRHHTTVTTDGAPPRLPTGRDDESA